MIFNCPECHAGHSVPVSMIPNGGLDMDCRRCGEAFTIEPPSNGHALEDPADAPARDFATDTTETDDSELQQENTNVGPAPIIAEPTRVGVANPFDFAGDAPLIGPGGIDYSRSGLDEENDDTERFDQVEEEKTPAFAPSVTEPSMPWDGEVSDAPSVGAPPPAARTGSISESMSVESTPSVYERVAAGIPVPEERSVPASSPSIRFEVKRSASPFAPIVDLLNRAPLALKVGLIVFPVTLGVMLVVNSIREETPSQEAPIEIPVAAEAEAATPLEASAKADVPEEAKPEKPPEAEAAVQPAPQPKVLDDPPAPAGFAYVQIEDARLRVRPSEKSGVAGRVPMGALVKKYDELGEWALVASIPDGPAGFLSTKLLGGRKPVALLARDQAFERCVAAEGTSVDDCLFSAKQQEQPCLDRCGVVNAGKEPDRLRCAEICSIAFDSCARSCRQSGAKIKPKRKKR